MLYTIVDLCLHAFSCKHILNGLKRAKPSFCCIEGTSLIKRILIYTHTLVDLETKYAKIDFA